MRIYSLYPFNCFPTLGCWEQIRDNCQLCELIACNNAHKTDHNYYVVGRRKEFGC